MSAMDDAAVPLSTLVAYYEKMAIDHPKREKFWLREAARVRETITPPSRHHPPRDRNEESAWAKAEEDYWARLTPDSKPQ